MVRREWGFDEEVLAARLEKAGFDIIFPSSEAFTSAADSPTSNTQAP